jgi:hypothetical protein
VVVSRSKETLFESRIIVDISGEDNCAETVGRKLPIGGIVFNAVKEG